MNRRKDLLLDREYRAPSLPAFPVSSDRGTGPYLLRQALKMTVPPAVSGMPASAPAAPLSIQISHAGTADQQAPSRIDPSAGLFTDDSGTLNRLVEAQARKTPLSTAMVQGDDTWSYAELEDASRRVAGFLLQNSIIADDVVAILARRSAALVVSMLGILKASARFIIVDASRISPGSLETLDRIRPRGCIDLGVPGGEALAAGEWTAGLRVRLALPSEGKGDVQRALARCPAADAGPDIRARARAYLTVTSGSTGQPKIISGWHYPVVHFVRWYLREFGITPADRFGMLSALPHDPLLRNIFVPLSCGSAIHIPSEADRSAPDALVAWLRKHEVTVVHLTPGIASWLSGCAAETALPSLRYVAFSGETLRHSLLTRIRPLFPAAVFINFYGATETPQGIGFHVVPDTAGFRGEDDSAAVSVGRGIDGAQLLVLDDRLEILGPGEVGEIFVRSAFLAEGYHEDDRLTRERFITNPYTGRESDRLYRTGDLGYYDEHGEVVLVGRRDRQVKLSGFRVELDEIETVIGLHPSVREAAVQLRTAGDAPPHLEAYITLVPGRFVSDPDLRQFLASRAAPYAIPTAFHVRAEMPRTVSGKIDYRRLTAEAAPAISSGVPAAPGEHTLLEGQLTRIWQELLGLPAIDRRANVFALGAQSLLATSAAQRITESCNVECRVVDVYVHPTISALAAHLAATPDGGAPDTDHRSRMAARSAAINSAKSRMRRGTHGS